jgi:uncharacterized membrane protein
MATRRSKRNSGPVQRAFVKGLSIALPAIITIAILAWVWDILRIYVVELTIQGIDSFEVFDPRPLTQFELDELPESLFRPEQRDADGRIARTEANLKRPPLVMELPPATQGLTPPGEHRSVLQAILDANNWKRRYDPITGRVNAYNWFDYLCASLLGLAAVVLLGFLARNFFGRKLVALLEWFVTRVPIVKAIYPHAKQVVDFFFDDKKPIEFDTVAIIEYPRRGLWAIVFVTGAGLRSVQEHTGQRMVTVYVPSSPMPMTGYTMVVSTDQVIQLDISVEEAMKFVVSGGVLAPPAELVRPTSGAQYALSHAIDQQVRDRKTTMLSQSQALKRVEEQVVNGSGLDDNEEDKDKDESSGDDDSTDKPRD